MRAILIFSLIAASAVANAGASCNTGFVNGTMDKTNAQKLADSRCLMDPTNCIGAPKSDESVEATTERQQQQSQTYKPVGS